MQRICILENVWERLPSAGNFMREAGLKNIEVIREKEVKRYEGTLYIIGRSEDVAGIKKLEAESGACLPWVWCNEKEDISPDVCKYCIESLDEVPIWYLEQVYAHICGLPWTVYEDGNFIVREMTVRDLPQLYELYGKSGVAQYVEPLYEYEEERKFTESYIENMYGFYGYGLWLVFEKSQGGLIGRIGFSHRQLDGSERVELGYIIDADYQNRGIGSFLCRKILAIGQEYWNFDRVFVCCDKTNNRSIALAAKLGFQHYATVQDWIIFSLPFPYQKGNGQN